MGFFSYICKDWPLTEIVVTKNGAITPSPETNGIWQHKPEAWAIVVAIIFVDGVVAAQQEWRLERWTITCSLLIFHCRRRYRQPFQTPKQPTWSRMLRPFSIACSGLSGNENGDETDRTKDQGHPASNVGKALLGLKPLVWIPRERGALAENCFLAGTPPGSRETFRMSRSEAASPGVVLGRIPRRCHKKKKPRDESRGFP
jgi:hypothetical protein